MTELGPPVVLLVAFALGLLASLTPAVRGRVTHTVATFGGRALPSATFVLGNGLAFAMVGLFATLVQQLYRSFWNEGAIIGSSLIAAAFALSMFRSPDHGLRSALVRKLEAVGGPSARGAFAMGLVLGLLARATTAPFTVGLGLFAASTGLLWVGPATLGAFALGLGVPFLLAGALGLELPWSRAWSAGSRWASGLALSYLAFAQLYIGLYSLRELARNPRYEPGIVAGLALTVGLVFAVIHVLAARRGSSFPHLSRPMRLASIAPAVFGGAIFFAWLPHAHGNAAPISWFLDEQYGRTQAATEHKPFVVVFSATWCCREVEHDGFHDPRVREEAARFVSIAVDANDDEDPPVRELSEKYKVNGLPLVIVFDRDGHEVARIHKIVTPAALVAELQKAPR